MIFIYSIISLQVCTSFTLIHRVPQRGGGAVPRHCISGISVGCHRTEESPLYSSIGGNNLSIKLRHCVGHISCLGYTRNSFLDPSHLWQCFMTLSTFKAFPVQHPVGRTTTPLSDKLASLSPDVGLRDSCLPRGHPVSLQQKQDLNQRPPGLQLSSLSHDMTHYSDLSPYEFCTLVAK